MTMRYGYDPSEVEELERQERPNPGQARVADFQEMMAWQADAGRRASRRASRPSPAIQPETQRPMATAMPPIPRQGNQPYRGDSRQESRHPFFPGEPTNVPYQPPMFNRSPIWNTQPGQAGYADMGYSINPMNPMWNPPWQPPSPTNYYPNNPNLQGVNRVFTPQEMNPNTAAGLLQQYGNPFFQQIGAQPYQYSPTGMGTQPGVSPFMMNAIRRAMNPSMTRYGSRGR